MNMLGITRRRSGSNSILMAAMLAAALAACGGGGGGAGDGQVPPAASRSFTSGAITGFGSVIVNGVRFDDSGAEVVDDEGRSHGRDDLKLGAQVEVEATEVDRAGGHGVAKRIRFGSEIVGPVEAIDLASRRLTVLGQAVSIGPRTVVDDSLPGGLAGLSVGALVEIHARFDAAQGVYAATRVEAAGVPAAFKLRGTVASLDAAHHALRIGGALIDYANAPSVPPQLADGTRVRVTLQTAAVDGRWIATSLQSGERSLQDHGEAEVKGLVGDFVSATRFSVDGLAVDASHATFPDGQAGVVTGAMVEVEGAIVDGVLVATKVQLEDEEAEHERGEDFELHGAISALDTVARSFSLRGVKVSYGEATVWRGVSEAQLADQLTVEVKGVLSADGTELAATRVSRED